MGTFVELDKNGMKFAFATMNVRSILAKLPDIKTDNNLRCAGILCFCETWLNESQTGNFVVYEGVFMQAYVGYVGSYIDLLGIYTARHIKVYS